MGEGGGEGEGDPWNELGHASICFVSLVFDNDLPIAVSFYRLGDFKCLVQLVFNLVFTQVRVTSSL